jgi:hypothetical protein
VPFRRLSWHPKQLHKGAKAIYLTVSLRRSEKFAKDAPYGPCG